MSEAIDIEILKDFTKESKGLLQELETITEQLEEVDANAEFPAELLSQFAQKIDRIMGAAQTIAQVDPDHLGLECMGLMAYACKTMGYKAAEKKNPKLIPIFAAFWAETVDVMNEILDNLADKIACEDVVITSAGYVQKRLEWLASKVDFKTAASNVDQQEVDNILKSLGDMAVKS